MADREFSWQKAKPAGDPAEIARVQADIDARNPTKPGQYTGNPVPLDQKEKDHRLSMLIVLKQSKIN